MCCFSGDVEVGDTKIFAGAQADGRQWLAYEMTAAFDGDVAMVLPLPVPVGSADDAVRFVSFEHLPTFFARLDAQFPMYLELARQQSRGDGREQPAAAPLVVHEVGAFVASFVPRREAFARLDPQFRLPESFFTALPRFADFGFAVFQLKGPPAPKPTFWQRLGLSRPPPAPARHFHPMVLDFPRRDPSKLFFPTVHLHDGQVKPTAEFDHVLYAQAPGLAETDEWMTTRAEEGGAFYTALLDDARGVLHPTHTLAKRVITGPHPNADVYL